MLRKPLPILSPEEDEALMRKAGFRDIHVFHASFAFRGWVARACDQGLFGVSPKVRGVQMNFPSRRGSTCSTT
jgi:hypothetical protein